MRTQQAFDALPEFGLVGTNLVQERQLLGERRLFQGTVKQLFFDHGKFCLHIPQREVEGKGTTKKWDDVRTRGRRRGVLRLPSGLPVRDEGGERGRRDRHGQDRPWQQEHGPGEVEQDYGSAGSPVVGEAEDRAGCEVLTSQHDRSGDGEAASRGGDAGREREGGSQPPKSSTVAST